jgi:hypothetical protein
VLLRQRGTNHALEDGDDPQGNGQKANEAHAMIIPLDRQRSQRQGMAFESAKGAFDQVFIAVGFERPGQP